MLRQRKLFLAKTSIVLGVIPILVYAYARGPDPRKTGAPGDTTCSQSGCHLGTLNPANGKVEVSFQNGPVYSPGVKQRLTVTVTDPQARVFGFQLTARLSSDERNGQAGDFTPADSSTFVICDDGRTKGASGCGSFPVQFIEHKLATNKNTFDFDWTPPATNAGNVKIYVAGNGANGDGRADSRDHIYTNSYTLTPAAAGGSKPTISQNGVVNGASFQAGIAQNAWITIRGANLASNTRIWASGDFAGNKLPTQLDGVSVNVNGKPAYVYYISPTQLNVLAPLDSAEGPVQVEVTHNNVKSDSATAQMQKFSPAFFLFDPEDRKYIAATHADGKLLGKTSLYPGSTTPAKPGEVVVLYGTGFGPTNPAIPSGELVTTAGRLTTPVSVRFGSMSGEVSFAGLTAAGLYQINVKVPDAAPDGDIAVVAEIGGVSSPDTAFLTIQK